MPQDGQYDDDQEKEQNGQNGEGIDVGAVLLTIAEDAEAVTSERIKEKVLNRQHDERVVANHAHPRELNHDQSFDNCNNKKKINKQVLKKYKKKN